MKMRFLAALFAFAALSCAPTPAARSEPALWRITDADSEIWLFGSAHILPPDLEWRGPRLNAAFAAAEELVTETDTGPEATAEIQRLSIDLGMQPPGQTLRAMLPSEDVARVTRAARNLNLDLTALDRLRPWLAALQISYAYAVRQGHSADAGVEAVLSAEARQRGMRMSSLETPEEQMRVLAELPHDASIDFLRATIVEIEADRGGLEAIDEAWARGDVEALNRVLGAEWDGVDPAVYDAIIARRNSNWTAQIVERLNGSGRILIVVGAAHLVGDDSVIAQLRARGIEVEGP